MGKLPRSKYDIFIDASTSWGIGGCCGTLYFMIPWRIIDIFFTKDTIARKELLAALVALKCFAPAMSGKIVTLYTDNSNVRDWLAAGRSSKLKGLCYLAVWERLKYENQCKVTPRWLPGADNISADLLSRGDTPSWLKRDGIQQFCD